MSKPPQFEIIPSSDGARVIRCNRPIEFIATVVDDKAAYRGFKIENTGERNAKLEGVLKLMADWYYYEGRKISKSNAQS